MKSTMTRRINKGLCCNEPGCTEEARVKGKCPAHNAKQYRKEMKEKNAKQGREKMKERMIQAEREVWGNRKVAIAEIGIPKIEIEPLKNTSGINVAHTFPYPEKVTIWHTSDGKEHGDELSALRWQLDIYREKLNAK